MKIYLTYNQQARLFSWLQKNKKHCRMVTGHNPLMSMSRLIAPMDLGAMTVAHADFTDRVQWWIDRHCPYGFAKSGKRKSNLLLSIKDWYYLKIKK